MATLQCDVDQGVRNGRHPGFRNQRQQFRDIVIVHRMHAGQMTARRTTAQTMPRYLARHCFDVARHRIIGFVTMDIPHQPPLGGHSRQIAQGVSALLHRTFEMRDAADHVHAHIQGPDHVLSSGWGAVEAVLRKGHQLQVEIRGNAALHFQHRFDTAQVVGGRINMGADRQKAHANRPVAIAQSAVDHLIHCRSLTQFAPKADALQERTRGVDPRQPVGQHRVHVKMRINKRGRDQIAGRVDHPCRRTIQPPHRRNPVALDPDIGNGPIGQRATLDQKIEHQRSPLL